MSGTAVVIIKIMPESPQSPLKEIEDKARIFMEHHGGKSLTFEQQNVAFGLKAIIMKGAVPESLGTDAIEEALAKIPHVSSISIEDYRRAFG